MQPLSPAELAAIMTLDEIESLAKESMSPAAYEYVAGGAGSGQTVVRNHAALNRIALLPRVLIDVSRLDTRLQLFNRQHAFPILLAPTGYHKLVHAEGELATVEGANSAEATLVAAAFSTVSFEQMAAKSSQPLWFQMYVQQDRGFTRELVERVLAAGCEALCITVDLPVNGTRDRELRAGWKLPPGTERANLSALGSAIAAGAHRPSGRNIYAATHAANVTWKDIEWLRGLTSKPLLLKGLMHPADGEMAFKLGCDGIVLSNHGGRSLDTLISTIEALPRMLEAVQQRIPVILDGGIRRGIDIFKALALGATAVMVGRPYLYGLAAGGAAGVCRVVEIMRSELEMTMALAGCPTLADIKKDCLDWL